MSEKEYEEYRKTFIWNGNFTRSSNSKF
jgi:hypothetical protein